MASSSWYLLVFTALGLAVATFAAIMSHIPRIPEQRGLLAVILVSGFAAVLSLLLTQIADPTREIEVGKGWYDLFLGTMVLVIVVALLDLFYFAQARRRRLDGAVWSLIVALALLGCGALGLYSQYGGAG